MELSTEKSATQKLESGKLVLERQNKELKAKLSELETAGRAKTKVFYILTSILCIHQIDTWILINIVELNV